jgi:hypothetical protein
VNYNIKIRKPTMKSALNLKHILFCIAITVSIQGCKVKEDKTVFENSIGMSFQDFVDISKIESPTISEDDINLVIKNKTKDCVVFPNDYGVKIFYKQGENWTLLSNLVDFPSVNTITLTGSEGNRPDAVLFIRPDYHILTERPTVLRILLTAYLCDNGIPAKELIGDYVDINL